MFPLRVKLFERNTLEDLELAIDSWINDGINTQKNYDIVNIDIQLNHEWKSMNGPYTTTYYIAVIKYR